MRKSTRIGLWGAVLLIVLGIVVTLSLETILVRTINRNLPQRLGLKASVAAVDLDPLPRRIRIFGLRIEQPSGFGSGNLLYLPEFEAKIRFAASLWGDVVLEEVRIANGILAPLLPAKTAVVLGGNAVDLSVDIHTQQGSLEGNAILKTIAGYQYEADISGTPLHPALQTESDEITYFLSRTQGAVGTAFWNLLGAGEGAAGGLTQTATELVKNTGKAVGSFGKGVLETATGIVTFDASDIGKGTKQMGAALAGGARDAVFGTGAGIVEGVGEISYGLSGGEVADTWRRNIPVRWTNAWQNALHTVGTVNASESRSP